MNMALMMTDGRSDPIDFEALLSVDFMDREPSKPCGADRLRKLHSDPDFASARDERGRDRFKTRREEMQRLSNATRRGYDVPPEKEADWKALKRKRTLPNEEIARMLGLKKWRKPRKSKGKRRNG